MRLVIGLVLGLLLCWAGVPSAQTAKAVYLAPYDLVGDRFMPRGMDSAAGCIDLRPVVSVNYAICGRESLPAGMGYVTLSGQLNGNVNAAQKLAIETALLGGAKLAGATVPEILLELLTTRASKKLSAGRDGKYKIWLGGSIEAVQTTAWLYDHTGLLDNGLMADLWQTLQPAMAYASVLLTETFTGADGDLDGATYVYGWIENGALGWSVAGNQATSTTTTASTARLTTALATVDHQVQAKLIACTSTGGGFSRCGVIGRKDSSTTATYYSLFADNAATGWESLKRVANTPTSLATSTQDPASSDSMTLIIDGSTVTGQVNGVTVVGPTTDTEITTGTYIGIYAHASTATFTATLDDVLGQDYPPASFGPLRRRNM